MGTAIGQPGPVRQVFEVERRGLAADFPGSRQLRELERISREFDPQLDFFAITKDPQPDWAPPRPRSASSQRMRVRGVRLTG